MNNDLKQRYMNAFLALEQLSNTGQPVNLSLFIKENKIGGAALNTMKNMGIIETAKYGSNNRMGSIVVFNKPVTSELVDLFIEEYKKYNHEVHVRANSRNKLKKLQPSNEVPVLSGNTNDQLIKYLEAGLNTNIIAPGYLRPIDVEMYPKIIEALQHKHVPASRNGVHTIFANVLMPNKLGGSSAKVVMTTVPAIDERKVGKGVTAFSFVTPTGVVRIAELQTGSILGNSFDAVHQSLMQMTRTEVRKFIEEAKRSITKDTIRLTPEEFFKLYKF